MAGKPKKVTEEVKEVKDEVVETKVEKVEAKNTTNDELAKTKAENEAMKAEIDQLKNMMLQFMSQQSQQVQPQTVSTKGEKVKIGSNSWGRLILLDTMGNEVVDLMDSGSIVSIPEKTLDNLMTTKNRQLFQDGLVYFVDEKWYEEMDIIKPDIPTEERLSEILSLPQQEMFAELDKITDYKRKAVLKNVLQLQMSRLLMKGNGNFGSINAVSQYFEIPNINNTFSLIALAKHDNFIQ